MVLTYGAMLLGCTGTGLICREEWSAIALATALEAPQTPGDTRNPIVKFIHSGQGPGDSVAGQFTHTRINFSICAAEASTTHTHGSNQILNEHALYATYF